ncbi:MAG: copper homeostasis protein CutC [Ignavibacteriae bacterium]|nr:copper homeostasis protein CutC [Ignavibacteriota bacterium]
MIKLEICINCDGLQKVSESVKAAYLGGASTIELCSAMHLDGLTPTPNQIVDARKSFMIRKGLMVMIRPRAGDFCYSKKEIQVMKNQINIAAKNGADGVVFGILDKQNNLDINSTQQLIEDSKKYNLLTTFHRAFDASRNPFETLDLLIQLGVNRILTSGTVWGENKFAIEGISKLSQLIDKANNKIEIVISGGINFISLKTILSQFNIENKNISFHSYSGVRENGFTKLELVKSLAELVKNF